MYFGKKNYSTMRKSLWPPQTYNTESFFCKYVIHTHITARFKFITVIMPLNSLKKLRWHCVCVRTSLKIQENLFKLTIVISSNRVSNQTTTFWSTAEVFKNSKVFCTHTNFMDSIRKTGSTIILVLSTCPVM